MPKGNRQTLKYRCTFASFLILLSLNPETVMYAMQPSIEHTSQWFIAQLVLFLVSIKLSPNNLIHLLLFPSLRIWSYCWPFQLTKICNLFFERKSMSFTSSSSFFLGKDLLIHLCLFPYGLLRSFFHFKHFHCFRFSSSYS